MANIETFKQTIQINLPVSVVYNQMTQFEEFPKFLQGVISVHQINDKQLHWKVRVAGVEEEWDAEIYEQKPDEMIGWRSTTGVKLTGVVSFVPLEGDNTLMELKLSFEPEGFLHKTAVVTGLISKYITDNLKTFKDFIEQRQKETGAWRGEIASTSSQTPHVEHIH